MSASQTRAPRLVDATGGLRWHMRALACRSSLWAPFRRSLAHWIADWRPPAQRILLVGPSAGWCLPKAFLERFTHVSAIDLDPAARSLFSLNHRAARGKLSWSTADFFADPARVLADHSDHAVLLCNVAGQRRFHHADWRSCEAEMRDLRATLAGRSWASFHDLVSGPGVSDLWPRALESRPEGERLLRDYGLDGEWLDHLTADLFAPSQPRMILPWRFKRDRIHLVEAGWSQP